MENHKIIKLLFLTRHNTHAYKIFIFLYLFSFPFIRNTSRNQNKKLKIYDEDMKCTSLPFEVISTTNSKGEKRTVDKYKIKK
jgi:hypothetical protein